MEEVLQIFYKWEYFKDKIRSLMSLAPMSLSGMNTGDFPLAGGLRHLYLPQLTRHAGSPTKPLILLNWDMFLWDLFLVRLNRFYLYYNQLEGTPREIAVPSTTRPIKGRDQHYSATTIRALLISSLSLQTHSNLERARTVFFFSLHILKPDLVFVLAQGLTWHLWGWTTSMCTSARLIWGNMC